MHDAGETADLGRSGEAAKGHLRVMQVDVDVDVDVCLKSEYKLLIQRGLCADWPRRISSAVVGARLGQARPRDGAGAAEMTDDSALEGHQIQG
jgi:hypothetical protein